MSMGAGRVDWWKLGSQHYHSFIVAGYSSRETGHQGFSGSNIY
jgi:hypothetical protein